LRQLSQTVASKGQLKFSLLVGSYDTFLSFFGLTNLTAADPDFYGLPGYASTMAFELVTEQDMASFPTNLDDMRVRFLFRNGSDRGAPLSPFPLFGRNESTMSWKDFAAEMNASAITSVGKWCNMCSSNEEFCLPYLLANTTGLPAPPRKRRRISTVVAGVIGAIVALVAVGLVFGLLVIWLHRRKTRRDPSVLQEDDYSVGHRKSVLLDHWIVKILEEKWRQEKYPKRLGAREE
jgi:hypothetical protein